MSLVHPFVRIVVTSHGAVGVVAIGKVMLDDGCGMLIDTEVHELRRQ